MCVFLQKNLYEEVNDKEYGHVIRKYESEQKVINKKKIKFRKERQEARVSLEMEREIYPINGEIEE